MSHANALLTPKGRLRLAKCIVEDKWPLRRAAERFQVSVTTAARWADRYRALGEAGMADRSSRPVSSPRRTSVRRERRIIAIRVNRRWGPARIGYLLGIHPSTVHRVLSRFGLARLAWLDRATGRVIRRYEHHKPGDLVHVDIKKLGRIPDGGGHRSLGRAAPPACGTRPAPRATGGRSSGHRWRGRQHPHLHQRRHDDMEPVIVGHPHHRRPLLTCPPPRPECSTETSNRREGTGITNGSPTRHGVAP